MKQRRWMSLSLVAGIGFGATLAPAAAENGLELSGMCVTPHVQSRELRYRRDPDFSLGARVQVFLRNGTDHPLRFTPETAIRIRGQAPAALLAADEWAWHDFPSAWTNASLELPPGALTVWSFNGKRAPWGVGATANLETGTDTIPIAIDQPRAWLSAVTFLGASADPFPTSMIFHMVNDTEGSLRLEACRLWLPKDNASWRALRPQAWLTNLAAFPAGRLIPARDRGGARVQTGRLPLTYAAVEVRLSDPAGRPRTLWAHLRIKREAFDISGGWVSSAANGRTTLTREPFLKTLQRMHVNTAHIGTTPGYTDNAELYGKYPLKLFNRLTPVEQFDTDAMLPRLHAVEFLGEPQYGGGRPVPPQRVWEALAIYQRTRLPTTVTHSEERVWRYYAGLSDYPHYDAYRVTAPSPDAWGRYDRWGGQSLRWGAPLETIGDMTRSLRELNRPAPIAYWSQGAHDGWDRYGGRKRTAPTPDELRAQAYHALSSRITSLYWFNLSLNSLLKFPDLIEPMTRVGREIKLGEEYYLEGDATHYERVARDEKPDWDLAVVSGPRGALLFALDLAYAPDPAEKIFRFGPPREATLSWPVPAYLAGAGHVLAVDADGVKPVHHKRAEGRVTIEALCKAVNVFLLTDDARTAERLETRRDDLAKAEAALGFNPAGREEDLAALRAILEEKERRP